MLCSLVLSLLVSAACVPAGARYDYCFACEQIGHYWSFRYQIPVVGGWRAPYERRIGGYDVEGRGWTSEAMCQAHRCVNCAGFSPHSGCANVSPPPPTLSTCTVTLNQNDVGQYCSPGHAQSTTVAQGQNYLVSNMHHSSEWSSQADQLTSIRMVRTDPTIPCTAVFYKDDNYRDCYWEISMPPGATVAESKHFSGDAGDSVSSFEVSHGVGPSTLGTAHQHYRHQCGNVFYEVPNCKACAPTDSSSPWCFH